MSVSKVDRKTALGIARDLANVGFIPHEYAEEFAAELHIHALRETRRLASGFADVVGQSLRMAQARSASVQ